jgi:hypothetical protein
MSSVIRFKDIFNQQPAEDGTPLSFKDMYVVEYRPGEDELVNYRAMRRKKTLSVGEGGPIGESVNPDVQLPCNNPGCECDPCTCGPNCACGKIVNEKVEYPHMMYDPKTGKGVKAETPADHEKLTKMGYTHDKPEVDEALTLQQRQKRARIMKRLKSRIKIGRERQKRKMADKGRLQKRAVKQARNQLVKKITKGKSKGDLSFARRQEIEKRLEKPAMKKRIERLAKRMFPSIRRAEVQRKKG